MSSEPIINPYQNWKLIRQILSLLRESGLGLTPSNITELLQEQGILEQENLSVNSDKSGKSGGTDQRASLTQRNLYLRVFRALQQMEESKLVVKVGKRFKVVPEAVEVEIQKEAKAALLKALKSPLITSNAKELQAAFQGAMEELLRDAESQKCLDLSRFLDD